MSEKPVIVVCGLGRCGSSLTMQMLAAGGLSCTGKYPAFEDDRAGLQKPIDREWFHTLGGQAVKVLDPHINRIPAGEHVRVIWLSRRPSEQCASIIKMMVHLEGAPEPNNKQRKRLLEALAKDTREGIRTVRELSSVFMVMNFEVILAQPLNMANAIAHYLRDIQELDVFAMAKVVRPRSPLCAPDMSMEINLMRKGAQV